MILLKKADEINTKKDEGIAITLNDTIPAKINIGIKGNTEQDTYEGKNLISISDGTYTGNNGYTAVVSNGKVVVNGTGTSSPSVIEIPLDNPIIIPAGTQVRISAFNPTTQGNTTESGDYFALRIGTASNSNVLPTILGNVNATATTSFEQETIITRIQIRGYQGSSFDNFVLYPQLELNSNIGHFEPYVGGIPSPNPDYPQDIKVVTGNNTIKVEGKNIWGGFANSFLKTNESVDFITNKDGTITANGTSSAVCYSMFSSEATNNGFLKTLQAGTYTVSGAVTDIHLNVVKKDGTAISSTNSSSSATFTIAEETQIFIRLQILQGKTVNNVTVKPMLERGSNVTSYETYKATTYPLNLENIELCKIGDYQDYIYKINNKWYKYTEIDKVILNGSETWNLDSSGTENYSYRYSRSTRIATNMGLSNVFQYKLIANTNTNQGFYILNTTPTQSQIRIRYGEESTVENFKSWLANNNVIVYCVLETPTATEITDTILVEQLEALEEALSYSGQTNITSTYESGNAPIHLTVEYLDWYEFDKILISGYHIKEDNDRITQKFANGHRKQIVSTYEDCIITINLGTFDLDTTNQYLKQLTDGTYQYYSLNDKKYKIAHFLLEQRPEIVVESSIDDDAFVEDYEIVLLKAGD